MLNQEMKLFSPRTHYLLFPLTIGVFLGLGLLTHNLATIGLLVLLSCAIGFMMAPRGILLVLLLIRPSMDIFSGLGVRFGPAALLNINAMIAVFVIILGVFLFLVHRHNFLNDTVSRLFALLLAITFIWGMYVSEDRMSFFAGFLRQLSCLIVFCLGAYLFYRDDQIRKLVVVCVMSVIFPLCTALYGLIEQGFQLPLSLAPVGPGAAIRSAPDLGIWLMLALIGSIGLLLTRRERSDILKWTIMTVVLYFLFILTYFRTAWAGFLAALIGMAIVKYRKMLLPVIYALLISIVALPTIVQRAPEMRSWHWRIGLWNRVMVLVKEDVMGCALGKGFGSASIQLHDLWGMTQVTIHNTYIETLFETGVVGIALFLVIRLILLKKAYSLVHRNVTNDVRALSIIVFGISIALFVAYIGQSLTSPAALWYFWILAGALCGVERRLRGAIIS